MWNINIGSPKLIFGRTNQVWGLQYKLVMQGMQFFLPVMLSLTILASHPTQPVKFSLLRYVEDWRWTSIKWIYMQFNSIHLHTQGALSTLHILLHQILITHHDHYSNINAIQNNKEIFIEQRNYNKKKDKTKKF